MFLNIFLHKTLKNDGEYDIQPTDEYIIGTLSSTTFSLISVPPNTNNNETINIQLSGITSSKLDNILDYNNEYIQDFILEETDDFIVYVVDNITYKTFKNDNLTVYYINKNIDIFTDSLLYKNNDKYYPLSKKTISNLNINRNNKSVLEDFYKLTTTNNLDDVMDLFSTI